MPAASGLGTGRSAASGSSAGAAPSPKTILTPSAALDDPIRRPGRQVEHESRDSRCSRR